MIDLTSNDLGETRSPLIPYTCRMDNPYPPGGTQAGERRYWEKPVPFEGARLVRLDVIYSSKGLTTANAQALTITLTDIHGQELHREIPLVLFSPVYLTKAFRTRYFRPFHWDPYKSYLRQVGSVAVNVDAQLLAYFVK